MIRNTINRLCMHNKWWVNDPDCIILRNSTAFTDEEIVGIAVVKALSGGPFIISDNMASVSARRMRIAKQLLPPTGLSAVPIDLLDKEVPELLLVNMTASTQAFLGCDCSCASKRASAGCWTLLGVCNWDEYSKDHCIPTSQLMVSKTHANKDLRPKRLHVLNFFKQTYSCIEVGAPLIRTDVIPAHSAELLAVKGECCECMDGGGPIYLGSNFHFSCGSEVEFMRHEMGCFAFRGQLRSHRVLLKIKEGFGIRFDADEDGAHVWIYLPNSVCFVSGVTTGGMRQRIERVIETDGRTVVTSACLQTASPALVILYCIAVDRPEEELVIATPAAGGVVLKIAIAFTGMSTPVGPDLELIW